MPNETLLRCAPWALILLACGCSRPEPPSFRHEEHEQIWRAPARDMTPSCADVGELRVCWGLDAHGTDCARNACVRPRPVPDVPAADAMGWRCSGVLAEHRCVPRSEGVGRFECRDGRCTQKHPRFPDDGEWLCSDFHGATVCLGGDAASGAPTGPADPAWICGARPESARKVKGIEGNRVCVDLSPDFPDGDASGFRCRYDQERESFRVCEPDRDSPRLGEACAARGCFDGTRCVAGRCLPNEPKPACYFDADCPGSACRFGSCREGGS